MRAPLALVGLLLLAGCADEAATGPTTTVPGTATTLPPGSTLPDLPVPTVLTVNACGLLRPSQLRDFLDDPGEGQAGLPPGAPADDELPALLQSSCSWPTLEDPELELSYLAPTTAPDGPTHLQDVLDVGTGFAEGGRVLSEDVGAETVGILLDADENVRELAVVHGSALVYLVVNTDVSARDLESYEALKAMVVSALTRAPPLAMALGPRLAGYLDRLGLDPEPPGVDALVRLHRAQVERVPYETVWLHEGRRWGIDPRAAVRRIEGDRRGGYCYHLNGAFSALLGALGYDVTRHVGGVHGPDGPDPAEMTNHLVLTVDGLPTDDSPGGRWFVDAGLGDALHEPLPLVAGTYRQGPLTFRLEHTPGGVGDWHFVHDPTGSFTGMCFREAPATLAEFSDRHHFLSHAPESNFLKFVVVQRRHAGGATMIRGRHLIDAGERRALERGEWFEALADEFGLVRDPTSAAGDHLWRRVDRAHEHWLAAQG